MICYSKALINVISILATHIFLLGRINDIVISIKDNCCFTGSDDGMIKIWRLDTGECIEPPLAYQSFSAWNDDNPIEELLYLEKEGILVCRDDDDNLKFWDVREILNLCKKR